MARIGIIGAGVELASDMLTMLLERGFEAEDISILGDESRVGEAIEAGPITIRTGELSEERLESLDLAVFAGDGEQAAKWVEIAVQSGAKVIDATPYSRRVVAAPLVVPELPGPAGREQASVLASPMPTTIGLAIVLAPLREVAQVRRAVGTVLEPVSVSGPEATEQLSSQVLDLMQGKSIDRDETPQQIAFNVRPKAAASDLGGWAYDERAVADELEALLGEGAPAVSLTIVHAPVFYGMAATLEVEFASDVSADAVEEALRQSPGVIIAGTLAGLSADADDGPEADRDPDEWDPLADKFPGPVEVAGSEAVHVGRIRVDPNDPKRASLWLVFDDVRKGVACNVVGAAEMVLRAV